MKRTVTDEELDLLAEGELTSEERADLFRRLDEEPSQWKACALAVLEAQALRGSLREILTDQKSANNKPPIDLAEAILRQSRPAPAMANGKPRIGWVAVTILLGLVACSLAGYRLGESHGSAVLPNQVAVEKATEKTNSLQPADDPLQIAAESTLSWLNVQDEKLLAVVRIGEGKSMRLVPIVSSPTLADQLQQIPPIPLSPERIQEANQNGWNILQHPQLITIDRPEAETKVVAVQMLRYKFAGSESI